MLTKYSRIFRALQVEFCKIMLRCVERIGCTAMAFKDRVERDELTILRLLNARMNLASDDKKNFYRLEKGFEGEKMFDLVTAKLPKDKFLTLNDLQLKANHQNFQVDSTVIAQETLNVFEVKNYKGDYEYDPATGRFYTPYEKEFVDPLNQVKRCETLIRCLLQELHYNLNVKAWLVFINPEFHLYHSPKNPSIIFPAQISRFMDMFEADAIPTFLTNYHLQLAEKLVSLHKIEPPSLPKFEFGGLQKGVLCSQCYHGFMVPGNTGRELVCKRCGAHESVESAVMRSVREIRLLFPGVRITTSLVYEWCKVIDSKSMIWRILKKNMNSKGYGKWLFFE
jgi:hypothetical protein